MRTGAAELPLHRGRAPKWLFLRMRRLGGAVLELMAEELGPQEILRRLADPHWFQALGCFLGYDWHSSGLTTTLTAALKEALRERDIGIYGAGGKGRTSLRTPREIEEICWRLGLDPEPLVRASRLAAKVDNAALQDGYQIYHHAFFFDSEGRWAVVQQGMNGERGWARRYHWLSVRVQSFVEEPHAAVVSERVGKALNMVAKESRGAREASVELARRPPEENLRDILRLPRHHHVPRGFPRVLARLYEASPESFQELLEVRGVGPGTVRALAMLSALVWGQRPSWRDPAIYSYAHGGKDGHPYPVDTQRYDRVIDIMERALARARLGRREALSAMRRLALYFYP